MYTRKYIILVKLVSKSAMNRKIFNFITLYKIIGITFHSIVYYIFIFLLCHVSYSKEAMSQLVWVESLRHTLILCLTLWEFDRLISKLAASFSFPWAMYKGSNFSTLWAIFVGFCCLFNYSHPRLCSTSLWFWFTFP